MSRIVLMLIFASAILYFFLHQKERDLPVKKSAISMLEAPEQGAGKNSVDVVGRVDSLVQKQVSSPYDGEITAVHFQEGQSVHKGDFVLRVTPSDAGIKSSEMLGELLRARSAYDQAKRDQSSFEARRQGRQLALARKNLQTTELRLNEAKNLYDKGIIPEVELDALSQQLDYGRVEVQSLEDDLAIGKHRNNKDEVRAAQIHFELAQERFDRFRQALKQTVVTAPLTGVLVPANSENGQVSQFGAGARVSKGAPLFAVKSTAELVVTTEVDEYEIARIKRGLPVTFTSDVIKTQVQGQVLSASDIPAKGSMEMGSPRYRVVIVPRTEEMPKLAPVRIGMSVDVHIQLGQP